MQALHRLAGVQEVSDSSTQPPAPVSSSAILSPPAVPPKDGSNVDFELRSHQRASLPLNRKPSHKSFRSTHSQQQQQHGETDGPPPNPSVPPSFQSTRPLTSSSSHGPGARSQQQPRREESTDFAAQRRHSRESRHSRVASSVAAGEGDEEEGEEEEEFAWGPSHPCFPHPNPHISPSTSTSTTTNNASSAASNNTRVIRVKRDWLAAGDLYPQYANLYPEILDPLVSEAEFRLLIARLNALLRRAFAPHTPRARLDSLLGALTGYLWDDLGFTGARAGERAVERLIEGWNREREREGREVRVVQLRRTGYMALDIVVPDPGIDVAGEEEEEGDDEGEREREQ